jgi:hypothetical protein
MQSAQDTHLVASSGFKTIVSMPFPGFVSRTKASPICLLQAKREKPLVAMSKGKVHRIFT